jgi:recombination protein RecA
MTVKNIDSISTGSLTLDIALGIGGFPRGRIAEIYGAEGCGKTTIALETIAYAQKHGGTAAFIDVEHALDFQYAKKLGVDVDSLLISQPDSAEEALSIAEIYCQSGSVDVFVLDSVAALVPQAELDGEMGDAHMGLQPKLMSQALRKMKGPINISKTVALFINQLRQKMGVTFGSPDVTPGGKALKFYATTRVDMRRISTVKGKGDDSDPVGHRVRAKVIKNKVAPPFRIAEFEMTYSGHGVNKGLEILEVGKKCGIVDQKGTWFSYGDLRLGNGKEVAAQFLMDNSDMASEIKDKILDLKMPHRRNDDADATSTEVRDQ